MRDIPDHIYRALRYGRAKILHRGSLDIGGNRKLQVENLETVQNFSTILGNRDFFSGTGDEE
ncbi:MAG: hypothetical protein CMB79_14310 [Filomicrobium sp.]|nr:hypothetical protein [Filomicrobium sp.]